MVWLTMTGRRAYFPKRSLLHRGSVGVEPGSLGAMQRPRPSWSWFSGKLEAPVTDATHASATCDSAHHGPRAGMRRAAATVD